MYLYIQVCGTDGVTYENICILRSLSANARVDYRGRCIGENDDWTPDELCERVKEEGLCQDSVDNCEILVQPLIGCCPVCGGFP